MFSVFGACDLKDEILSPIVGLFRYGNTQTTPSLQWSTVVKPELLFISIMLDKHHFLLDFEIRISVLLPLFAELYTVYNYYMTPW